MLFPVPDRIRRVRDEVHAFMTERVEPAEPVLNAGGQESRDTLLRLRRESKQAGLWALGERPQVDAPGPGR